MARDERSAGFIVYHRRPVPHTATDAGVAADIFYLLLDYGRHWDFPKGHMKAGENALAAATRELEEETGLAGPEVAAGFRHEIVYYFRDRKKGLVRKAVTFFLAELASPRVVLSDEHVGFAFLPYEQAVERVTYPSAKEVLRAAHAHLVRSIGSSSPRSAVGA